jgi:hypothetical protein
MGAAAILKANQKRLQQAAKVWFDRYALGISRQAPTGTRTQ